MNERTLRKDREMGDHKVGMNERTLSKDREIVDFQGRYE